MPDINENLRVLINDLLIENFAFLIGGGASISSNVKSPYDLAYSWFTVLHQYMVDSKMPIDEDNLWVKDFLSNEKNWKEPNLDDHQIATISRHRYDGDNWFQLMTFLVDGINNSYFQIATMLEDTLPNGREVINSSVEYISDNAQPRYGYLLLAYLLSQMKTGIGKHDVVITTNFDDMLINAFYDLRRIIPELVNSSTKPRSITMGDSKEQLSRITVWNKRPERPIIFHVHNSQEFNPRNTARDVSYYPTETIHALQTLLENRCLLVMGYSGSDEGLMTVVKNSKAKRIYWLSYSGDRPKNAPFRRLESEKGRDLVLLTCPEPSQVDGCPKDCDKGFDSFMWKLVNSLHPECPIFSQTNSAKTHDSKQASTTNRSEAVLLQYATGGVDNTEERKTIINLFTYEDLGKK